MIVSDKILPIRFYNNLFDQNRFNALCYNNCELDLVYPPSRLPSFQFKTQKSLAYPDQMFIRKVCDDNDVNYYKAIPEGADTFCNSELVKSFYTFTNGGVPPASPLFPWEVPLQSAIPPANYLVNLFDVDCCAFKMLNVWPLNPTISYVPLALPIISFPIQNLHQYHFRIIVEKLCGTSTIDIYENNNIIGTITQAGTHDIYFTSTGTAMQVIFNNISEFDCLEISYMQATIVQYGLSLPNDILLNPSDIAISNLQDGNDVLTYCSPSSFNNNIPDGSYYYVVYRAGKQYYSEVFKIESLEQLQHYFKLEWYDDCDFNDSVIYSSQTTGSGGGGFPTSCTLKNILYLDAALFSPEYNTVEESEENGKGDLNVRFKKWQKSISLDAGKSPEFLTDALSAIFLHKFITITEPLNKHQDIQSQVSNIIQVTSEVSDILGDCFQRVILKLLLEDKITDSACCNLANTYQCPPCKYTAVAEGACGPTDEYYIQITNIFYPSLCPCTPTQSYILRRCSDNSIVNVRDTDLICYQGRYFTLEFKTITDCCAPFSTQQAWVIKAEYPVIINASFVFIGYQLTGRILPNTFGQVFFQVNCAGPWILAQTFSAGSTGNYAQTVPISVFTPYMPYASICFKVINVGINCFFGESNIKTVI